eukprot:m.24107 g.24107  ORF g.24107 m.24107 type:complete len:473 (-) comp5618_c0_seq1:101-1519(-)
MIIQRTTGFYGHHSHHDSSGRLAIFVLMVSLCASCPHAMGSESTAPMWTHAWDSLSSQLWADFGFSGGYSDLTKPTSIPGVSVGEFIANNYQIVSLEKCLYRGGKLLTESAFVNASTILHSINKNLKVLFYYASDMDICSCYKACETYDAHPEWWVYDNNGHEVYPSNKQFHYYNSSVPALRDFWSDMPNYLYNVTSSSTASMLVDGVFADGIEGSSWPGVSEERALAVYGGRKLMLNITRAKLGSGKPVFGNGIDAYPQFPMHGMDFAPVVDGFCVEHVASFEQVLPDGTLNVTRTAGLISNMAKATAMGKMLLVRTWPGPVTEPINSMGPSYPSGYGPTPTTYAERQHASISHEEFADAIYLIVASDTTFYNYNWWYDVNDGVFPCNVTAGCSGPATWFPNWAKPLGAPKGPAIRSFKNGTEIGSVGSAQEDVLTFQEQWDAPIYDRQFEHVTVHLDLSSRKNTFVLWDQ